MKDRKKQRANRRIKLHEEKLNRCNEMGIKDLTAFNAVNKIISQGKSNIVLS